MTHPIPARGIIVAAMVALTACTAESSDDPTGESSAELRRRHVDGVCGSANGVATSTKPTSHLCSAGIASSVRGTGPFQWTCFGMNGGTSASCSAPLPTAPPPPPPSSSPPPPPPPPPPGGTAPDASRQCSPVTSGDFERYGLPPTKNLPSGVSFLTDWTQNPIAGGFNGKQAVDDCRMHADGFMTWHGKAALRVEVNPGDDPLNLGTERAELLGMQDASGNVFDAEGGTGQTIFYATSYYFPTTWDGTFLHGDGDSWSAVNQFYGWGSLAAGRRDVGAPQMYYWSADTLQTFTDGSLIALGKWTDFVFQIDYATGAYTFYRRDEGQNGFNVILTGTSANAKNAQYYKEGLYRGPDVNGRTDVLWIGPASRGTSFAAVEQASFGTNVGP